MEKKYFKLFTLMLTFICTFPLSAQINLAPSATVSAYTPDPNGLWNWNQINNGVNTTCNVGQEAFIWTSSYGLPDGTEYMQWDWSTAKSINKLRIHNANSTSRNMTGADVYYWNGSTYSFWKTVTIAQACFDSVTFPTITTTRLRLTNFKMTGTGQLSNPNWREIEVISGPSVNIDAGISSLTPLEICSGTQSISVRAFNFGKKTIDSFRLNWSVNGTLQSPVRYVTSRLGSAKDTLIVLNSTFSFTNNTNYTFRFWTSNPNGTIDSVAANDTLTSKLNFLGNPSPPITTDFSQCGQGRPLLTAVPSSTGDSILWYNQSTGGTLLGIGKSFLGPIIKSTTTFYSQAMRFGGTSTLSTGFGGNTIITANTSQYNGAMFNVNVINGISVDSITFKLWQNNPTTNYRLYYKLGTHVGSETNSFAWTLISSGQVRFFTSGGIFYGRMSAANLFLPGGQLYGFYVTTDPTAGGGNDMYVSNGGITVSNSDMSITGNRAIGGLFASQGVYSTWTANVEFMLKKQCSNPSRSALTVTVKPRPIGADVIKGTVYKGQFRQGSPGQPDITAPSQPVSYELVPPTGYNNADHGSTWVITSVEGRTKSGLLIPSADYSTTNPSSSGNGTLTFNPSVSLCDSMVTFSIKFSDLGPHFCDSTVTRVIRVAPTPKTNFDFPTKICDGSDVVFNNLTTVGCGGANNGFANYKWYFGDGDSSDLQNPTHLYATYGCYPVRLVSVSSPWNIVKDTTILVCVTEVPTVQYKVINACEGIAVKFVNQTTIGSGSLVYTWIYGDNTPNGIIANPSHLYASPGGYKVTLKVSASGCENSLTKNAYQFAKPVPNFSIPLTPVCAGTPITFPDNTTISLGEEGSYWTYGDGNYSTLDDGYNTYLAAGTYNVKLKSVSEFGCTDSITKQVTIKPSPNPDFITNKLCSGEPTNFLNTTVESVSNPIYTWTFSDNSSYNTKNVTKSWSNEGTYKGKLRAEFTNGCSGEISKDLVVLIQPAANFSVKDICSGEVANYVNLTTGDKGFINYNWDLGNGASSEGAPKRLYDPSVTTTYTVVLSASYTGGCADTAIGSITVSEAPKCDFAVQNQGFLKYQFTPSNTSYTKYEWFFGEGGTSEVKSPLYQYTYGNMFKVKMLATNQAGCQCEITKSISANTSINNVSAKAGLNIYPNPNTGAFTIASTGTNGMNIEVYNLLGSKILNHLTLENTVNINLGDVAKGIYLVKVTVDGMTTTNKVTITE